MLKNAIWPALVAIGAVLSFGCFYVHDSETSGPVQTESRAVELGGAESARVEVRMGAGDLNIAGGAQKLMEAEFRYDRPSWKPDVRYDVSGLKGVLTIQQPQGHSFNTGNAKNEWNLKLNNDARIDMTVALGAGEGHLDLGTLALKGLDIEMGAGELRVDLRGSPRRSYDVRIRGGVGDANIYLPNKAGIIADVKGGLGAISAHGMEQRGDSYVNSAYQKSEITIHLDVKGGIGSINLYAE